VNPPNLVEFRQDLARISQIPTLQTSRQGLIDSTLRQPGQREGQRILRITLSRDQQDVYRLTLGSSLTGNSSTGVLMAGFGISGQTAFLAGRPGRPMNLSKVLEYSAAGPVGVRRARFAFAYVTSSGLQVLLRQLARFDTWEATRKKWLVGVHHGITEPRALEQLRSSERSHVRLYAGGSTLNLRSLVSGDRLHAKVACFDAGTQHQPTLLVAGSANLTGAALSPHAENYEAGLAYLPGDDLVVTRAFDLWWHEVWTDALEVTDSAIDKYAALRRQFLDRNPDAIYDLEPSSALDVRTAKVLWIAAGAMSGGSRNQVEFNEQLATFFTPDLDDQVLLRVLCGRVVWNNRPLTPKTTTFGVKIWRLSLPTSAHGAPSYPGRVLRFTRTGSPDQTMFRLDVADEQSRKHQQWIREAHRVGLVAATSGNRMYGLVSSSHS